MKKKTIALLLACMMVLGVALGGTLAWLTDTTESVVNTFTVGNIDITLTETTTEYKMIPGYTIAKDPKVTVDATSEDCWLFVELIEAGSCQITVDGNSVTCGFNDFIEYTVVDDWTAGTGLDTQSGQNGVPVGVYFRKIVDDGTTEKGTALSVLTNDKVSVKETVTKAMMDALDETDAVQPTLTFTAYACQYMKNNTENFTPAEAWTNVNA